MPELKLVSCLEKVFPDTEPASLKFAPEGLIGEEVAFQAAWTERENQFPIETAAIEIVSPIKEYISVKTVRYVPVRFPALYTEDTNYLRDKKPGLYPDALDEIKKGRLHIFYGQWEAAWISVNADESLPAGDYPITVRLVCKRGETVEASTVYHRIGVKLPEQKLIHTRWFHCDGLCQHYHVKMFSEKFWEICENFVKGAVDMSVNCLLTPIHTPPLDTAVGGERMTCQLVDIEKNGNSYTFGFEKLDRWVEMGKRCGIKYFELAHLFSQWGAKYAPKIMAKVNGRTRRIFGWNTEGTGAEYSAFLQQYVPAVIGELTKLGVIDNCIFHISDEPNLSQLENYMKAKDVVKEALKGRTIIDALSNIEMYESGAVEHPVPATDHIKPFLEANIPDLWAYYCIGQRNKVSNAFIGMPSARTRIIGAQLYKYNIAGFLQWGFNFYNSQYSEYPINPYFTTDGDGFSPAGDCFIVYPGEDGKPMPTLRSKVFAQATYDLRAMELLEGLTDKQTVMSIIENGVAPIEFDEYPKSQDYIFDMRHRINAEIEKRA